MDKVITLWLERIRLAMQQDILLTNKFKKK